MCSAITQTLNIFSIAPRREPERQALRHPRHEGPLVLRVDRLRHLASAAARAVLSAGETIPPNAAVGGGARRRDRSPRVRQTSVGIPADDEVRESDSATEP